MFCRHDAGRTVRLLVVRVHMCRVVCAKKTTRASCTEWRRTHYTINHHDADTTQHMLILGFSDSLSSLACCVQHAEHCHSEDARAESLRACIHTNSSNACSRASTSGVSRLSGATTCQFLDPAARRTPRTMLFYILIIDNIITGIGVRIFPSPPHRGHCVAGCNMQAPQHRCHCRPSHAAACHPTLQHF